MNIDYFTYGHYGWGQIFRDQISTEDEDYISHTDDSVTFVDSYTDLYDEVRKHNATMTRKFDTIRNELIANHKQKILELQREVDVLEASDSFENYNKHLHTYLGNNKKI